MFLSVFDIFKVGVGPSSSHTMGPMVAAGRFLDALRAGADRVPGSGEPARLGCRLHGSLAFTGKGHATDRAVILGLAGFDAGDFDAARAAEALARIAATGRIAPARPARARLRPRPRPRLRLRPARCPATPTASCSRPGTRPATCTSPETYYSIGGGFVLTARELDRPARDAGRPRRCPTPSRTAAELLAHAEATGLGIAAMQRANELAPRPAAELDAGLARLWAVMTDCIDRGLAGRGRAARRPQGPPPRPRHPRAPAGRARPEPDRAAHHQRLDLGLRHRGQRGERRRRPGRHRPHQRRRRRGARHHPLLPRPRARRLARRASPTSC